MTTIEDTFGEKMSLTRAAAYLKLDRRLLKKVYRSFGGFDLGDGHCTVIVVVPALIGIVPTPIDVPVVGGGALPSNA